MEQKHFGSGGHGQRSRRKKGDGGVVHVSFGGWEQTAEEAEAEPMKQLGLLEALSQRRTARHGRQPVVKKKS